VKALGWIALAGIVCALVIGALSAALGYALYGERSHPATATQVIVARGSTFDEIARRLAGEGVISNVWTFRLLARLRGEDVAVHAGEYRFMPHRTQDEILRALVTGGAQVAGWVTIPEGFTAEQIARRLAEAGVGSAPEFSRYFTHQPLDVYGVHTKNLEGFLFPSTYLVPLGAAPSQAAGMLTTEFFKELPADAPAQARKQHVSVAQAVTVASLVEREAKDAMDRPRIAEVIYNRLRLGMPLQIDATIEYALPKHKSELSFSDLKIDSPYNTYTHAGLPPTPIANPGLPSLEAALHPWKSDDLYYVYCGSGRHVFAKTLAEHQANVARCLQ
jgi:UPF0755 protein